MFFNEILLIYIDGLFYANKILAGIVHESLMLLKVNEAQTTLQSQHSPLRRENLLEAHLGQIK
jgi:hypothetical protein